MARQIEKGTIKVAWLEKDSDTLYSKMFDDVESAKKFAKDKKDYLIMKLVTQKEMEEFSWKVLPFGKYKLYGLLFKIYRSLV